MKTFTDNLVTFFIIWVVIIILNQLFSLMAVSNFIV